MKLYKSRDLEVTHRIVTLGDGSKVLSVGLIASFPLSEGHDKRTIKQLLWLNARKAMGEKVVFDEGNPKHQSEFLVYGSCFRSDDKPQPLSVTIAVGPIKKQLVVYGDRHFQTNGTISKPTEFGAMAITPENAFGGDGFAPNPIGKGMSTPKPGTKQQLPNIETLQKLMAHSGDIVPVSGFWSLPADHPVRVSLLGKFDDNWFKTRWPNLPLDTQPEYFQVAPKDQRFNGYLNGDESICITNMHEHISLIQCKLPAVRTRLIYEDKDKADNILHEVSTKCETLYLYPNDLFGLVLYRGVIPLDEKVDADGLKVYADVEKADRSHVDAFSLVDKILRSEVVNLNSVAQSGETTEKEQSNDQSKERTQENSAYSSNNSQKKSSINSLSEQIGGLEKTLNETIAKLGVSESDIQKLVAEHEKKQAAAGGGIEQALNSTKKAMLDLFKNFNIDEKQIIKKMIENPKSQAAGEEISISGNGVAGLFIAMEQALSTIKTPPPPLKPSHTHTPEKKQPEPRPQNTELTLPLVYDREHVLEMLAAGNKNFSGLKLSGADLSGLELSEVDFSNSQMEGVNLSASTLTKSKFDHAVLRGASFRFTRAKGTAFKSVSAQGTCWDESTIDGCDFTKADWTKSSYVSVTFTNTTLSSAALFDCNLAATSFENCTIIKGHFDGANLSATTFASTNLSGSTFVKACCTGTVFVESDLTKTNFSAVSANGLLLKACNADDSVIDKSTMFSRSTFTDTTLNRVNWQGLNAQACTFLNVAMVGSLFSKANFGFNRFDTVDARGASLDGASFYNADLLSSNFMDASFKSANLEGCRIIGCNFFAANLLQASTKNLIIDKTNIDRTVLAIRQT